MDNLNDVTKASDEPLAVEAKDVVEATAVAVEATDVAVKATVAGEEKGSSEQRVSSAENKTHTPIKRSTMVAVGASITAVLLAVIITIVVIAVQISSVMTTVFFTNFGSVDGAVRNNIFIASVDGDYSLYEGDRLIGDKYSALEWNDELDGYIFSKTDGSSGVLDYNGNLLYSVSADDLSKKITRDLMFTTQSVTYVNALDSSFITVDFKTKNAIPELNGLRPIPDANGKYFIAGQGGYAILQNTFNGSIVTKGSIIGSSATFEISGSSQGAKIVAISANSAIIKFDSSAVIFGEGLAQTSGEYYKITAEIKRGASQTLHVVGGKVYYSDLTFSGFSSATRVYAKNSNVQIGSNIYAFDGEKLTLKKANARLVSSKKEADYYYILGGTLYSSQDKELYKAKNPAKFKYLGQDIILDGDVAQTLDGKKKIENVKDFSFSLADEVIFTRQDNSLATINGTIYTAKAFSELGEVTAGVKRAILPVNGGYMVKGAKGVYISASDTILSDMFYINGIYYLGGADNIDNIVAISKNQIDVYNLGSKQTLTRYHYSDAKVESNNKYGLVYSVAGRRGVITPDGKLVEPQYATVNPQKEYMIVSLGKVSGNASQQLYAVATKSGKLLTSYEYAELKPYGDYIKAVKANLERCIINTSGKELYNPIADFEDMRALEYSMGEWRASEQVGYSKFLSNKGYKVMKYAVDI